MSCWPTSAGGRSRRDARAWVETVDEPNARLIATTRGGVQLIDRTTRSVTLTPAGYGIPARRLPDPPAGRGRRSDRETEAGRRSGDCGHRFHSPVQARYFHELLISTFTIAGATPRYVQYVTQVHTTLHPEGVVFRTIGAFRERPVEFDAVWRGDSTNSALMRMLRDVLPQREWTTDDLVEEFAG